MKKIYSGFVIWILFVICHLSFGITFSCAAKVTILYTGETHSMLYSCDCPMGLDGGLAKRATKISQARKDNPNILLVDSGGMFAGGLLDEYSQSAELDKKRTLINLDAVKLMGYDAVAIGDEEFNFGEDFLRNAAKKKGVNFISSNLENDYSVPFLIKDVGGVKIGILALTNSEAKDKAQNIKYIELKESLEKNIKLARGKGAEIILVLSHLGEEEDPNLINQVSGVDIWVYGHRLRKEESAEAKIKETIVLRPTWQGRKLGKAHLEIENGKIKDYKIDDVLIDKKTVQDDQQVAAVVLQCFSNNDCRKNALFGTCENAATSTAKCVFKDPEPVSVLVIQPKNCVTCEIEKSLAVLRESFPIIKVSYLNYESNEGQDLAKKLNIEMLPVYLLGKEIEKSISFKSFSKFTVLKDDKYLLDPSVLGVSYFTARETKKLNLDLFISLFDRNAEGILRQVRAVPAMNKNIKLNLHFLGISEGGKIITPYGIPELEEDIRSVCVMNKYPDKWWDYLFCRAKNIQSTWWDSCMDSCGLNINSIKLCSGSGEGKKLLLENISLSSELKIRASGTFLLDNREVFSTLNVPSKDELDKVFKAKGW